MSFPSRLLLRLAVPMALVIAPLITLSYVTHDQIFAQLSVAFTAGVVVGNFIGGNSRLLIIRHIYGDDWHEDAVLGRWVREWKERTRNPPPPV